MINEPHKKMNKLESDSSLSATASLLALWKNKKMKLCAACLKCHNPFLLEAFNLIMLKLFSIYVNQGRVNNLTKQFNLG